MNEEQPTARDQVFLNDGDRPLPRNLEAEAAVLAAIMLDPQNALDPALHSLRAPGSFFHPPHQVIFNAMLELNQERGAAAIDLLTLTDLLDKKGKIEEIGGAPFLRRIMDSLPTAANIEYHVDIVYENATLRRLIKTATRIVDRCYDQRESVRELVDRIEGEISQVVNARAGSETVALGEQMLDVITYLEKVQNNDPSAMGIQTGYPDLDRLVYGLKPGEMFVLAARPSIGKTALALNMAENIALGVNPVEVGIFSLEMSTKMLALRLLCSQARVNIADIRENAISRGRWEAIGETAMRLRKAPIFIDDASAGLDVMELRNRARRMKREHGIKLLMIDYLQLLRPVAGNRNTTRENEVSQISGCIKGLANELGIPIIVLAQLNRQAEQPGARPRLSHLRESGAIEQDADVVALLHREREESASAETRQIEAELIIAKHRNGPTGLVPLLWMPSYTRFESRSAIADEDVPEI